MKIVFVSNYYNHHQAPLSCQIDLLTGHNYYFIAMMEMEEERKRMGWEEYHTPPFVLNYSDNPEQCNRIIKDSDVIIVGSAGAEMTKYCFSLDKLTFYYTERIHKAGYNYLKLIKHIPMMYWRYGRYKKLYCLCASAFTAYDFSKTFTFLNRTYRWGYFPPFEECDDVGMIDKGKESETVNILYVSRLIPWKHPEYPVEAARKLKKDNVKFRMTIIGRGGLKESIVNLIKQYNLQDVVTLIDSLPPAEVRKYMQDSDIFLLTSDRNEGWGAVLNESMNSRCAVVASSAIGSVPYLLVDENNGLIYKDGDFDDFYIKVKLLCNNGEIRKRLGLEAYRTISQQWNANIAAARLIHLSEDLMISNESNRYTSGPCSKAPIIKDNWYN